MRKAKQMVPSSVDMSSSFQCIISQGQIFFNRAQVFPLQVKQKERVTQTF